MKQRSAENFALIAAGFALGVGFLTVVIAFTMSIDSLFFFALPSFVASAVSLWTLFGMKES